MAKSDFICAGCGTVISENFFKKLLIPPVKYKCPKCGDLCKDCVDTHLFGKATCKSCGSKTIKYKFNGRWMQD